MHPSSQAQTHYCGSLPSVLPIRAQSNILLHYSPISAPYQPRKPKGLASTAGRGNVSSAAICGDGRTYWKSKQEQEAVQRAGPPALDRLLFGRESPLHGRKEKRELSLRAAHTHIAYCTYMCRYIWVNLMHMGSEIQASTFFRYRADTWDHPHIRTEHMNFQEPRVEQKLTNLTASKEITREQKKL